MCQVTVGNILCFLIYIILIRNNILEGSIVKELKEFTL